MPSETKSNRELDEPYETIRLPRFIAEQFRAFIAERATGTFEISCVDGAPRSAAKRVIFKPDH